MLLVSEICYPTLQEQPYFAYHLLNLRFRYRDIDLFFSYIFVHNFFEFSLSFLLAFYKIPLNENELDSPKYLRRNH
jgi:hypothetical protein